MSDRPDPQLESPRRLDLGHRLRRAADGLDRALREALQAGELTALERDVLEALRATPSGLSEGALADRVILPPRRLGTVLAGLEAQQLIRHRPESGAGHIAVTVMGVRALGDHERRAAKLVDEMLDGSLDPADRRALDRVLDALGEL